MRLTSSIPFFGYVILDRMAYYALRSILWLFLLDKFLNVSFDNAMEMFSTLTNILLIGFVVGGLLGLINQPKIVTLSGILLKISGIIVLFSSHAEWSIMVAFVLVAIGTGITRTNELPFLGQIYKRSNLLTSGLMLNYLMVYIGAIIGAVFFSFVLEQTNLKIGFIVVGILYFLSGIILLFAKSNTTIIPTPVKKIKFSYIPIILVLAIFGVAFYWLENNYLIDILYNNSNDLTPFILEGNEYITNGVVFILTISFAIYFTYKKITTPLLLGIGFFAALLSVVIMFILNYTSFASSLLILFFIFSAMAEVFLIVPLHSFIIRKFNSKYSPIVFASLLFIVQIILKIQSFYTYEFSHVKLIVYALLMFVFSAVFFLLYKFYKKSNEKEELKEF